MNRSIKKTLIFLVVLGIAAAGYYYYKQSHQPKPEDLYRFQAITKGDVEQSVNANGTINPVSLINVGAQVSGRVKNLYVDFNDKVKKDQIMLELDDSLFTAQIAQTEGNVRNIQASLELAKANEARLRTLFAQEYVSRQELDTAVQAMRSAQAQLDTARAQLQRDKTNLSYSIIRSPVAGVVVDRVVAVGQTVAASFQTPTLITIAQDLSKMQINTSFAEADIGNIKEGQKVKFTVDAFPSRNFEGVVKQLRLNPTNTSNVVVYNVVVSVDNPDEILLPGMTAYVNIAVADKHNVMLAPNGALRYKPKLDDADKDKAKDKDAAPKANGDGPQGAGPGGSNGGPPRGGRPGGRKRGQGGGDTSAGKVFVLRDGKPAEVKVRLGITDGRFTEIKSKTLRPGDQVIVGEIPQEGDAPAAGGNNQMRMRMF